MFHFWFNLYVLFKVHWHLRSLHNTILHRDHKKVLLQVSLSIMTSLKPYAVDGLRWEPVSASSHVTWLSLNCGTAVSGVCGNVILAMFPFLLWSHRVLYRGFCILWLYTNHQNPSYNEVFIVLCSFVSIVVANKHLF